MLINNQKEISEIKKTKNKIQILKLNKRINIKFIFYTILSISFSLLFWAYISSFCYVYSNTQYILFKDIAISFTIGILYPFPLYLIPTLFRYLSYKYKKECLFKLGKLIELAC